MAGLLAIYVVLVLWALIGTVLIAPRFAVDMEIPLRAAERWQTGQPPYLASAFASPPGATQPFLYPPYLLPFFALLTDVPRLVVGSVAIGVMLGTSILACRRLGIPWVWLPLVLAWPPFAEAIYGANIQTLLFAAFVFLFYLAGAAPWLPRGRDLADPSESGPFIGVLATVVGAVKISQPHPWLYVLLRRPHGAIVGALVVVAIVLATVPLTGPGLWFDWIAHLQLASDPTWDLGGFAMPRFLPPGVGLVVAAVCVVAVWFVPRERAGAWIGVLLVVGSLSLHIFGLLFLVPAMLLIRREAAIVAGICIATYSYEGSWAGILIVALTLVATTFGQGRLAARFAQERA
jgi:hypothetical protein